MMHGQKNIKTECVYCAVRIEYLYKIKLICIFKRRNTTKCSQTSQKQNLTMRCSTGLTSIRYFRTWEIQQLIRHHSKLHHTTTQQPDVPQLTGSYQTVRYLHRGEPPPPHPLLSPSTEKVKWTLSKLFVEEWINIWAYSKHWTVPSSADGTPLTVSYIRMSQHFYFRRYLDSLHVNWTWSKNVRFKFVN